MFSQTAIAQSLSRSIARVPATDGLHHLMQALYTAAMLADFKGELDAQLEYRAPAPYHPIPGHPGTQVLLCRSCVAELPPYLGKHSEQLKEFFGYLLRIDQVDWYPINPDVLWEPGEFAPCDRCGRDTRGSYDMAIYGGEAWELYGRPESVRAALGYPDFC